MTEDNTARSLGEQLRALRRVTGESLRTVADATGYSGAYLQKLERDEVKGPSPHLLRELARHFKVSYLTLMQLAGYATADGDAPTARTLSPIAQALAGQDFSPAEQRAIAAFIATLRAGRES